MATIKVKLERAWDVVLGWLFCCVAHVVFGILRLSEWIWGDEDDRYKD